MTFLEQLQSHKGGLICLKTELFWYEGRGWDGTPGRICLILDAATIGVATTAARRSAAAHLLIDGQPAWIWVVGQDIELLVNNQPIS